MFANPLAPEWLEAPAEANSLPSTVWSRTAARAANGELTIAGVTAGDLVSRFGTPVYVVDEADAIARATEIKAAFDTEFARIGSAAKVYYAGKAFLCTEVVRWMTAAGLNIDVASAGEMAVALAAGVDASRLGFHGNNKSLSEIDRAVRAGIGPIVIDSVVEIGRVAEAATRHGRTQRVRLRINSGVHASTHEYLATAREDQKFGVPLAEAEALVEQIRSHPSLDFVGIHSHIGSQIFDTAGFAEAARRLLELHARLSVVAPVPELNLGGGFGIAYTSVDQALPVAELAASLATIVEAECARLEIPVPIIAIEPGRSIIGPSTTTLYTVGTIKDVLVDGVAVRKYVSVDGGMSDNIRPALYEADYSARIANRVSDAAPELARIVGKHCEAGDIVVRAEYVPGDVAIDDVIAVPATGAYGWAMSNNYNYLARPPVVAVRDGHARIIVRGETEDDLLSRDAGIKPSGDSE
ncbi:diaminopimelate decarboxylase [Salinibacterium sp. NSLL150]|uniref:diaminopimelate decarboxylase n=1 Tax=unclassified Salinibacterium TaxID=2632331 RepID=UPI0018CD2E97|nr:MULTISPECIES: diaminopimelate decarboxylase [unclassified Salinibacterium]MBH0025193.1 diaminopimelate decarboxylase [Salinibacterium sp. SWN248]MBH0100204.1 diaminopimelate decarboxylase [Salinibacterium sp. NSLL35]MBH0102958.1 diaminopimelate decarboxylase [Salinibacterium sp. NSLL150]MBH0105718.1 diaminopimelate decarboxylase [Salinibacterium sp. NSLL16]MBH0108478.1 diaminopimelate decarboxylase [Salinibacterium sp. NSLL17]